MKVLQINSVCGYGSTGRIAVDLYNSLKKNGNDCVIAYGRGNAPEGIKAIKIDNQFEVNWHVFLTRILDRHGYASKRATKKLIKQIEMYNPDIIHLHNIHGYYLNQELLFNYLKKRNKPVVWTLHDCWAFTGHCAYFDYEKCDKWKKGCSNCPLINSYPKSLFYDNSKKNYLMKKDLFNSCNNITLVTPSKWLANLIKQSFLHHPVEVIYNGIDLQKFRPQTSNLRKEYKLENKFIILGVASKWEERKGINSFIKLSGKLDENYQIILIGVTEKDKKVLPSNIIAISRTDSIQQLAEFYTMADVFVNPTMEDNFPTTNLEALACGTPVITYNTGGSVECINENSGLIVESNSVEELVQKIYQCRQKKFKPLEESDKYDKSISFTKYLELYNKLINEEKNE